VTALLVVTDVDSTLIRDEVIELLADEAGARAEITEITTRAMHGDIDFRESLHQRVAALGDLPEAVLARTLERVRVSPGAEELIAAVHERDGRIGAISGGFSQILEPLAERLGLDLWRANELEVVDGRLTGRVTEPIVDARRKAETLAGWAAELGVPMERTVAVGDGANDLQMMAIAGVSVGYRPKPVVAKRADVVIPAPQGLDAVIPFLPR
jgi:phosphoserine phosphatase